MIARPRCCVARLVLLDCIRGGARLSSWTKPGGRIKWRNDVVGDKTRGACWQWLLPLQLLEASGGWRDGEDARKPGASARLFWLGPVGLTGGRLKAAAERGVRWDKGSREQIFQATVLDFVLGDDNSKTRWTRVLLLGKGGLPLARYGRARDAARDRRGGWAIGQLVGAEMLLESAGSGNEAGQQ